jgi:NhaP-type Na+/H+ or K+/H+ antiporter
VSAVLVITLALVVYALVSTRLATTPLTGPMIFMVLGVLLGSTVFGVVEGPQDRRVMEAVLEAALALVLFTDALGISSGSWRAKGRLPARLLLVGMPLTIVLGWLVARPMFPDIDVWEAALIGICLAPTDAALGQAVVTNPRVPASIRQALNIESGLNDGLALPFFVLALAAVVELETSGAAPIQVFVEALAYASAIGGAVGWVGAHALAAARERGWVGREWGQIATLGLVVLAYGFADSVGGSGFIATWVAGVVFGRAIGPRVPDASLLTEDLGGLLATASFLGFGTILLGPILERVTPVLVVYAIVSLTVIRLVPVAVALVGTGLRTPTVLFMGWFGPRGLASIVFGLLIAEEAVPGGTTVLDVIFLTVALSVVLHGVTAAWGADRYGSWYARIGPRHPGRAEDLDVGEPAVRRRLRTQRQTE